MIMRSVNLFSIFRFVPIILVLIVVLVVFFSLPPKQIVIETGPPNGFFDRTAHYIQQKLWTYGIEAKIKNTLKTISIVEHVNDINSSVDVGFVAQDLSNQNIGNVSSLGSIMIEPLFAFYRRELNLASPKNLEGLTIAMGPKGGGTRVLAENLLNSFGVNEKNTTFLPITQLQSIAEIKAGRIDVAFFLQPPETEYIKKLGTHSELALLSFNNSEAISRNFDYLKNIKIPEGGFDLEQNLPSKDIKAIGIPVTVVGKKSLDPAIAVIISYILKERFSGATLVTDANTLPADLEPRLYLNRNAEKVFQNGLPEIFFVFPFKIAALLWNIGLPLLSFLGIAIVINSFYRSIGFWSPVELWQKARLKNDLKILENIRASIDLEKNPSVLEQETIEKMSQKYDIGKVTIHQLRPDPLVKTGHAEVARLIKEIGRTQ